MKNINNKKNNKGFTLIELMVSVGIFSLVMLVSIGAVLSIVGANKKAQTLNNVITNLNFAFETMMRDIRTGYTYNCSGTYIFNIGTISPSNCNQGNDLSFISTLGETDIVTRYKLNGTSLQRWEASQSYDITAPEVKITSLDFYVTNAVDPGDKKQPTVLVILRGNANIGGTTSDFNLQALVTQRAIDQK